MCFCSFFTSLNSALAWGWSGYDRRACKWGDTLVCGHVLIGIRIHIRFMAFRFTSMVFCCCSNFPL